MDVVRDVAPLRAKIREWRAAGDRVALVPTMGALHEGHLSLVGIGRRRAHRVIASIFVNPKQFGAHEDLDRYPRQEARDGALLQQAGCDLLFLPSPQAVYPDGFSTSVSVAGLDRPMEGASRPGHFDGVATVVAKLLLMAFPDIAIFGEKDWQQLAIIRRMVADLNIPVDIIGAPILRDPDGLAMSSRNAYLDEQQRSVAGALPRTLHAAAQAIAGGAGVAETLATARAVLASAGFKPDYLTLADGETLEPLETNRQGARLFVAAKLGPTRIIDNMPVPFPGDPK
ncbi:pantoate--beta-alanine ligase [Sandaracinobacter sp. RS1-74]|uniref:pantoate--beta-alanine ligase n=1 Tax=Sandaracinobacteroides sayramensis TaxID=2913411 RepID=UPI001EDC0C0E|nr:pantoate--beta-alanine ligase [Sandaracinobacteroides sayramensis]MCG2842350.1 pantoate--beta-alanine ligase [Sandaracinobacteroides sayramensis]